MKAATIGIALLATGCATGAIAQSAGAPAEYDAIIAKHSRATGVPEALIRRVIVRESKYNPRAMHGGHYGMMQIKPATAKSMGYRGSAAGLLDADINLTYAVRYLAGAYKVAGGDHDRAVRFYASGYYYDAKRRGMLAQIGMGRDGALSAPPAAPVAIAAAAPVAPSAGARVATLVPSTPAQPAAVVPTPPVRGAAPASAPVLASLVSSTPLVPLPQPRGPVAAAPQIQTAMAGPVAPLPPSRPADPRVAAPAAPALAAVAPTPRSRASDPVATGSIASADRPSIPLPPTRAVASAAPTSAQPAAGAKARVISPTAAPVFASAVPVPPTPPAAPQGARPAPVPLSYAQPDGAAKTPFPPRR